MHMKKPSFHETDSSPSWTHKSDSLPNFGVNRCPRKSSQTWRGLKWFGFQKATWWPYGRGLGRLGTMTMKRFKPRSQACKLDMCFPSSPVQVMETRTHLMYLCSSIALFKLHLLQYFHMVGCLCHVLTHEQLTWFD
jgi:hypothetical protein